MVRVSEAITIWPLFDLQSCLNFGIWRSIICGWMKRSKAIVSFGFDQSFLASSRRWKLHGVGLLLLPAYGNIVSNNCFVCVCHLFAAECLGFLLIILHSICSCHSNISYTIFMSCRYIRNNYVLLLIYIYNIIYNYICVYHISSCHSN